MMPKLTKERVLNATDEAYDATSDDRIDAYFEAKEYIELISAARQARKARIIELAKSIRAVNKMKGSPRSRLTLENALRSELKAFKESSAAEIEDLLEGQKAASAKGLILPMTNEYIASVRADIVKNLTPLSHKDYGFRYQAGRAFLGWLKLVAFLAFGWFIEQSQFWCGVFDPTGSGNKICPLEPQFFGGFTGLMFWMVVFAALVWAVRISMEFRRLGNRGKFIASIPNDELATYVRAGKLDGIDVLKYKK